MKFFIQVILFAVLKALAFFKKTMLPECQLKTFFHTFSLMFSLQALFAKVFHIDILFFLILETKSQSFLIK